jgi:3-hydroxyisobutyrate dehydrogenase-like beta-hydroxyacid dehydrogenase
VGNDDDVRSVVYGEQGVLASMAAGSVLVDHTTASAELARELAAACAKQQLGFLDAPVSGGQAGAEKGILTVMVGGEAEHYQQAELAMQSYSRCIKLLGPAGSGQLAKMVNQICIAGVVQGLAEALNFAKNAGLDGAAVVEVISQGAASSWQMQNRSLTMLDDKFDFGFAVDWMRKDLAIALNEARKNGSALPLTALVDQFYAEVQKMGGGRWDTSSLIKRLSR